MEIVILFAIILVIVHYRWTRPAVRSRARVIINRKKGW